MADVRKHFKVSQGFTDHPKIVEVGMAAAWLYLCSLDHCARHLTDGFVQIAIVSRLCDHSGATELASKLLAVGLWHATGHRCERCPTVPRGSYLIHDYLDHQTSAEHARAVSAKRAAAGRRGGMASPKAKPTPSNLLGVGLDARESSVDDGKSGKSGNETYPPGVFPSLSLKPVKDLPPLTSFVAPVPGAEREDGPDASAAMSMPEVAAHPAAGKIVPPTKRGSRLPEPFPVDERMKKWFGENIRNVDGPHEHSQFCDYWWSASGNRATKVDWFRAWCVWMRKAMKDSAQRNSYRQTRLTPEEKFAKNLALVDELRIMDGKPPLSPNGYAADPYIRGEVIRKGVN